MSIERPQQDHPDLGLDPEADHTEDLCPQKCENPGGRRGFHRTRTTQPISKDVRS